MQPQYPPPPMAPQQQLVPMSQQQALMAPSYPQQQPQTMSTTFVQGPPQGGAPVFVAQQAVATSKSMYLDVFCIYEYRGHHRAPHNPLRNKDGGVRKLRLTVDATRTAGAIRDEVLKRSEIVPLPYQLLGVKMASQGGFELSEGDLIAQVAARGEHLLITLQYRKDASKGFHVENRRCEVM